MALELLIDPHTGIVRIGDLALLQPNQTKGTVEPQIAYLMKGSRDHGNGFEWLDLVD